MGLGPAVKKIAENFSAFTLIELLVVMALIGTLATLLLANFNAARERARDAQRKSDLRNIQTALRLYYNDYDIFPDNSGTQIRGCGSVATPTACPWGSPWTLAGRTYMNTLASDPKPDRAYQYDRLDTDPDIYTLGVCLENESDRKCSGNEAWCPAGTGCVYSLQP